MLVKFTAAGIYCPAADVYIDPWKPVRRAVITHAHSDHARPGSGRYLAHHDSEGILKYRLGNIQLQTVAYNEKIKINGIDISLHPAGHIIGSSQVRLSNGKETWVISGDYKVHHDGYTVPFEPVKCTHFVTESTFGLPIYNFPAPEQLDKDLNAWIAHNASEKINSVVLGYALGKSQRILKALNTQLPVMLHGSVYLTNEAIGFSNQGYIRYSPDYKKGTHESLVVVAPGSVIGSNWLKRFEPYRLAVCSGWMQLRGTRRRMNADKGFPMSDHADWSSLNEAVLATGAENVYVTHGYKDVFARWLREKHKLNAGTVETQFEAETMEGIAMPPETNTDQP